MHFKIRKEENLGKNEECDTRHITAAPEQKTFFTPPFHLQIINSFTKRNNGDTPHTLIFFNILCLSIQIMVEHFSIVHQYKIKRKREAL